MWCGAGVQLQKRRPFEAQGKQAAPLQIRLKRATRTVEQMPADHPWYTEEKRQEVELPASRNFKTGEPYFPWRDSI
jgi:hypothetical protein